MKIAFIDFILDPARPGASGLSDIVWNMAREFARAGDDVHVIGPYSVDPKPVPGITVHRFKQPPLGYRNIAGHILIVLAALRVARRIPQLDAIHAPEYLTTGILSPLSRTPVILTTPGNIYERIANGNPFDGLTTNVLKVAARSSARWCTLINAISSDMGRWWIRTGAEPGRVVLIPHGVDTSVFRPMRDARAHLGLSVDSKILLYAGRLSAEKHVDALVRLLPQLEDSVSLHILGGGPLEAKLREYAALLNVSERIRFHGQIESADMPFWYSAANCVALPSSSEGLPRVMLEALACGAPFVGTRITGIVDVIENGKNGLLFEAGDEPALLSAVQSLVADQSFADRLGARAREDMRLHYDWPLIGAQLRAAIMRDRSIGNPTALGGTVHG